MTRQKKTENRPVITVTPLERRDASVKDEFFKKMNSIAAPSNLEIDSYYKATAIQSAHLQLVTSLIDKLITSAEKDACRLRDMAKKLDESLVRMINQEDQYLLTSTNPNFILEDDKFMESNFGRDMVHAQRCRQMRLMRKEFKQMANDFYYGSLSACKLQRLNIDYISKRLNDFN